MRMSHRFLAIGLSLQEAADKNEQNDLSAGDIRRRLSDSISDAYRGSGNWGYYVDHFGDAESGDVIYVCNDDTFRTFYTISYSAGAAKCLIDMDNAVDVVSRVIWEPEQDEADHIAAMEESMRAAKTYTSLPLYERFISKKERDSSKAGDFAGKNRSFPILKKGDVQAAVRSMGRAGSDNYSIATLKANIIRIAKVKGFADELPDAWTKGDGKDAKESGQQPALKPGQVALEESAAPTEAIVLRESKADYPVKLIAPGAGSSAYYTPEVLKRDGPSVFVAGMHMYVNHPTAAEESSRPEGDWRNLAAVLTENAHWEENGPKGAGLYSRMKVFSDHGTALEEKAPYTGVSIRAIGETDGTLREGKAVVSKLVAAHSVDIVTRAGAGGVVLTEAASAGSNLNEEDDHMSSETLQAAIAEALKPVNARLALSEARNIAVAALASVSLPEAAKARITERALANVPTGDTGALDVNKLNEALVREAKAEGEYLAALLGSGRVHGMGTPVATAPKPLTEAQRVELEANEHSRTIRVFEALGLPKDAATAAATFGSQEEEL